MEYLKNTKFYWCVFAQTIFYLNASLCMFYFADFQVEILLLKALLSLFILLLDVKPVSPLNCLFLRIHLFNSV